MPAKNREPVKVLITIDTEAWPYRKAWREEGLEGDLQRDIYGITEDGEFGLAFQCSMLRDHDLKGIFFVEALFASVVGINPLRQVVEAVRKHDGQTVELHAHPEWLEHFSVPGLPAGHGLQHFHQLAFEQQVSLLDVACKNLRSAGVGQIRGFRAGNYGANLDTCRALATVGVSFDFSYDAALLGTSCKFQLPDCLFEPTHLCGVIEYPTAYFEDYPGHIRHAQLCACSSREMQHALNQAWEMGWRYFVILSHSFELTKRRSPDRRACVDPTALHRMQSLCRFLKENNDRFETTTCESLGVLSTSTVEAGALLRGSWLNTVARYAEQAWVRLT